MSNMGKRWRENNFENSIDDAFRTNLINTLKKKGTNTNEETYTKQYSSQSDNIRTESLHSLENKLEKFGTGSVVEERKKVNFLRIGSFSSKEWILFCTSLLSCIIAIISLILAIAAFSAWTQTNNELLRIKDHFSNNIIYHDKTSMLDSESITDDSISESEHPNSDNSDETNDGSEETEDSTLEEDTPNQNVQVPQSQWGWY